MCCVYTDAGSALADTPLIDGLRQLVLDYVPEIVAAIEDSGPLNRPRSEHCSAKGMERARQAIVEYLRDTKGPRGKRSVAHLLDKFRKRFPSCVIGEALIELVQDNQVYHQRSRNLVGSNGKPWKTQPKGLTKCNALDWIVYNPYPKASHRPKKAWADPERHKTYCSDHPYPCYDPQIWSECTLGKWSRGQHVESWI